MQRIALVTGAGRGIGRSIALGLAKLGHRVALTARTQSELDEVAAEIASDGGEAHTIIADLSQRESVKCIIDSVTSHWGNVEILVNNAGVGSSGSPRPIVDFDDDYWDLTFEVNVRIPYSLTKATLPAMIEARWGRIINISSINSKIAALHGSAYTASKHALSGFTKSIAKETGDFGITANAVCPGVTATRMNDLRIEYDAARMGTTTEAIEAQASPLGRRITPDEVAEAAIFLASEGAAAINGQMLNVCGGTVVS